MQSVSCVPQMYVKVQRIVFVVHRPSSVVDMPLGLHVNIGFLGALPVELGHSNDSGDSAARLRSGPRRLLGLPERCVDSHWFVLASRLFSEDREALASKYYSDSGAPLSRCGREEKTVVQ